MMIESSIIFDIFDLLNKSEIEYVLLRNINDELPYKFEANKDIDILVRETDYSKFRNIIQNVGWKQVKHPWDFGSNFVFLYAMNPLEFFEKGDIHLDVCYQLCCRSVNAGEWMPVDQLINNSVWKNKKKNENYNWYELCNEDLFVHLLTRCVLDKKEFKPGYKTEIERLIQCVDERMVRERLELVFFKFTDELLRMIREKQYDDIVERYLKCIDY